MITKRKLKTTKTKETVVKEPKTAKMKNLKAKAKELQAKELQAKEVKATVKATVKTTKPKVVKKTKVTKPKETPKKVIGKLSEERQAFEKSINKGEFSILKTKQRGKRERNYLNELAKSLETTVKWFNRTKTALPELTSINLKFNNIKLTMK